jgi:hypothetical protein
MNADEFLKQIEKADKIISNKIYEVQKLRLLAVSTTVPTDREVVQTSGVSDKVGNIVAKIIDLECEINDLIDEYVDLQRECIGVIESLESPLQYTVLHKHYVQYKSFAEIAEEEHYSYDGIMKVKRKALEQVDAILNEKSQRFESVYSII